MTPSLRKPQKGSEQCQDDCTGEKFVRIRAVSQIDRKQWGAKRDLDRFYVNTVLRDQTALVSYTSIYGFFGTKHIPHYSARQSRPAGFRTLHDIKYPIHSQLEIY